MDTVERLWYNGSTGRYRSITIIQGITPSISTACSPRNVNFGVIPLLHAGEVKSYIQLCLAISHQALVQRGASRSKTQSSNEKYTFRTWLLRLGMIGDEFKTARLHLLKNLEGNIAARSGAGRSAKERFAAKRLAERREALQAENEYPNRWKQRNLRKTSRTMRLLFLCQCERNDYL